VFGLWNNRVLNAEVLDRWQVIQSSAFEKDQRLIQKQQQWAQLKADLRRLLSWLEEAEAVQARQTVIPSDTRQLEAAVRRQRVCSLIIMQGAMLIAVVL
jgi:hypothetical protein